MEKAMELKKLEKKSSNDKAFQPFVCRSIGNWFVIKCSVGCPGSNRDFVCACIGCVYRNSHSEKIVCIAQGNSAGREYDQ